jgi:hypothetical protein
MKEKVIKSIFMALMMCCVCFSTSSCSKDGDEENLMESFSSLFSRTDYFIDMLDTVYEHYDIFGSKAKDSSDGKYTVTPTGRLIIVKKKAVAGSVTYTEIELALKTYYKNEHKVNDVCQNNGGTITIDCRN